MNTPSPDRLDWQPLSKRKLSAWSKLTNRKGREQSGQILVEGIRSVGEALATKQSVVALVASEPGGIREANRALSLPRDQSTPLYSADSTSFAKLSDTVQSAGVVAIVEWSAQSAAELDQATPRRVLFCDAISDPGNLGTLIRTAAGLGIDLVIAGDGSVEVTNPKVIRSTAGTLFRIPVYAGVSVGDFLERSQRWGLHIVLADPRGSDDIEGSLTNGWVAVVGGETTGLNGAWPREGVSRLKITMHHGVESLNAAVAGSLMMDRLRHKEGTPR